jgi:hypothetical protein
MREMKLVDRILAWIGNRNSGSRNSGRHNSGNCNSGDWNSGHYNSGSRNSGRHNSGDCNSGWRNSGDCNSGNRNSGHHNSEHGNSGNHNSGSHNSGHRNSGDWNSGNWNSGDWNLTDGNSGCFCTETHTIKFFDKDSNWTLEGWRMSDAYLLLMGAPLSPVKWISEVDMTDEEKAEHPEHTTTGGYLKELSIEERTEAAQKWWDRLDADKKQIIKNIPNFDPVKFKQITGIEVEVPK